MIDYIKIRKLIRSEYKSLEEFAKHLNICRPSVSLILAGKRKISAEELKLMANLLHVNIEDLYIKTD